MTDYWICERCNRIIGYTTIARITRVREWMQYYLKGIGNKPKFIEIKCLCGAIHRVDSDFKLAEGVIFLSVVK